MQFSIAGLLNPSWNQRIKPPGIKADELADILSLVLFIAHELSIDMNEAWQMMLASDENKFVTRKEPSS